MKRVDSRPRREGWQPVAPGIYEDHEGQIHLSVPELMAHVGLADTPEHRQDVIRVATRAAQQNWPGAKVQVRE